MNEILNLIDQGVNDFFEKPQKKLTPEELEGFLNRMDASPQLKEVFRKYHTDEAYAKAMDDRVNERAIRLYNNYMEKNV